MPRSCRARDRQWLKTRVAGEISDSVPIGCQRCSGLQWPAAAQAVRQNSSVHRACAGAAYADDLEIRLKQQAIEYAPGEGAMRTAALESNGKTRRSGTRSSTLTQAIREGDAVISN